jgi:antirestriction protein
MPAHTDTARVYVGTYAKYNNGSIKGAWLDLDDYADHDDFIAACQRLHSDEHDPELMFQDYEGFPSSYYEESSINPEVFDWLAMGEDDREMLEAYRDHVNDDGTLEDASDAYHGHWADRLTFAQNFADDTGILRGVPDTVARYFDYESYARDLFMDGFTWADGHVFSS